MSIRLKERGRAPMFAMYQIGNYVGYGCDEPFPWLSLWEHRQFVPGRLGDWLREQSECPTWGYRSFGSVVRYPRSLVRPLWKDWLLELRGNGVDLLNVPGYDHNAKQPCIRVRDGVAEHFPSLRAAHDATGLARSLIRHLTEANRIDADGAFWCLAPGDGSHRGPARVRA